jgi:ABC-2 type transport system permease protein
MVPSITALILLLTTTLLTSLAVVKEKELGTLEQLIVTPIKPWQMVLGKLIPFVILGFATMALVNSIMIFWFGIPIRGSIIFYLFSSFLYILSTLGLGLFISTISKTQQQAMMVSIFGAMMPMIYLSGFAFPIENMPKIIQYITYAIPMRYFITIIRGVILKGIGFADLWREALMLFIMGITILFLSSLRFKKRLE